MDIWKKYIDLGEQEAKSDPFFNFIVGYTLSLHGCLIALEYEEKGHHFMVNCFNLSDNAMLRQLAENFLMNEHAESYIPVKNAKAICAQLFDGKSLLDEYFNNIYDHSQICS